MLDTEAEYLKRREIMGFRVYISFPRKDLFIFK